MKYVPSHGVDVVVPARRRRPPPGAQRCRRTRRAVISALSPFKHRLYRLCPSFLSLSLSVFLSLHVLHYMYITATVCNVVFGYAHHCVCVPVRAGMLYIYIHDDTATRMLAL